MPWPDIFFKAKKRPDGSDPTASAAPTDVPKIVDPPAEAAVPPSLAPAAPDSSASGPGTVAGAPVPKPGSQPLPPPRFPATTPTDRATRTLPVVHGVILRPPAARATSQLPAVTAPPEPIKNIEQLMTEADPVKTLSQTGNLRMLRHISPEVPPVRDAFTPPPIRAETTPEPAPPEPAAADVPAASAPAQAPAPPVILPPKATEIPSPWPSFPSKSGAIPSDPNRPTDPLPPMPIRKAEPINRPGEPIKVAIPATSLRSVQPKPASRESTFSSRPIVTAPPTGPNRIPPPLPPMIQVGSIAKRKAKLADVARIVLPPKREETGPLPSAQTNPVSVLRTSPKPLPRVTLQQMLANTGQESPFLERSAAKTSPLPPPVTVSPAQTTVLAPIGVKDQTVPMRDLQRLASSSSLAATSPLPSPVLIKPVPTDEPASHFAKTVPIPELQRTVELPPIPPVIQAKAPAPTPPPIPAPATATPPAPEPVPAPVEAKQPEIKPEPFLATPPPVPAAPEPAPVEAPKPQALEPAPLPPVAPFVPKIDFAAPTLDSALVFDPETMPVIPEPPPVAPAPPPVPIAPEPAAVAALASVAAATVTATSPPSFEQVPQVDSEAHKTSPEAAPRLDPEAHKVPQVAAPTEAEPSTSTEIEPIAPGTREFHLTNGERVAGVVLSETPETIYLQHPSLGVLTLPRDEIATRLAEIILINGDRIVGNIMAETSDTLYVRHSSLGMLSVPKAQRSARVVEAILKNGDRILGEVVTETDTFTVIKSATLGTVTVPHAKVSMLNRKVEQVEMKALPPALQAPPKA